MNRKPVVFLSSTYFDLKKERSYAIRHIIKNHYIFSGMEAFFMIPMMEQWENIKRTIRECDIYVAVLGERYGYVAHEGKSCTELECEYAAEIGKPIVALIESKHRCAMFRHKQSSEDRRKQQLFKDNIRCDYKYYWSNVEELIKQMFAGIHQIECERNIIGVGKPIVREKNIERTPMIFRTTLEYSDNLIDWNKRRFVHEEIFHYELDNLIQSVNETMKKEAINREVALYCFIKHQVVGKFSKKDIVFNSFYINEHDIQNALELMEMNESDLKL